MAADTDYVEGLRALADLHQERLSKAMEKLQARIAQILATAPLTNGALNDLKWAVKSKAEVRRAIEEEYLLAVDALIREYNSVARSTAEMLAIYGGAIQVPLKMIRQLQKMSFQVFEDIGQQYLDVVSTGIYQSTLANSTLADTVATVQKSITVDMARYVKQQAHDSLMQFDASINVAIGVEAGAKEWKYVGRLITTTRPFCRKHEGKTYTSEEIARIWKGSWAGKQSGNPFIVRGGYNCGHQFRPVFAA